MDASNILLSIAIAVAALAFGVLSGRANANRMRDAGRNLKDGRVSGLAVFGVVAAVVVYQLVK